MTASVQEQHRELRQLAQSLGYSLRKNKPHDPTEPPFKLVRPGSREVIEKGNLKTMAAAILDLAQNRPALERKAS